ncbi:malate synthase A, partial [Klebsiella pneumoniae]
MEDAATAEISRAQIWQWIRHPEGKLTDGRQVTVELFRQTVEEELTKIEAEIGEEQFAAGRFQEAKELFDKLIVSEEF